MQKKLIYTIFNADYESSVKFEKTLNFNGLAR